MIATIYEVLSSLQSSLFSLDSQHNEVGVIIVIPILQIKKQSDRG